jgi:hypothetical protein
LRIEGADFSYGVGHNLEEAELALRNHKAAFCRARFGIPNHYRFSLDLAFAHARRHARAPAHSLAIHSSFRPGGVAFSPQCVLPRQTDEGVVERPEKTGPG